MDSLFSLVSQNYLFSVVLGISRYRGSVHFPSEITPLVSGDLVAAGLEGVWAAV